ncbi:MAG TPA: osmotically inducible protein C [Bacteroidales bacterium]|nr:MAG: osmotically inducible protein C [Bacteroidetes bacterium GWE2_42_24]OFY25235.1 MAG: osmotically inducible protein C [Bacteroidetes bacterium GWF2_43_11]HAQ65921.1 osmotically inducible protein C [Bacteroidales bacterium]HBZ66936.1 osmotically inducible protein C [Bacteroidales bacterium]
MDMIISFEGKAKVNADYHGMTIHTDQPLPSGDGSAPAPFDLFLASIGTCAGIYVKSFCDQRGIPTDNIRIVQSIGFDKVNHLVSNIKLDIQLPASFPEKYRAAVLNAADICAVKRHLQNPPKIETLTSIV